MLNKKGQANDVREMVQLKEVPNWCFIDKYHESKHFHINLDGKKIKAVKLVREYEYKIPEVINLKGGVFPIPLEKRVVGILRISEGPSLDFTKYTLESIKEKITVVTIDVNKVISVGFDTLYFSKEITNKYKTLKKKMEQFNYDQVTIRHDYIINQLKMLPDYWGLFNKLVNKEVTIGDISHIVGNVISLDV